MKTKINKKTELIGTQTRSDIKYVYNHMDYVKQCYELDNLHGNPWGTFIYKLKRLWTHNYFCYRFDKRRKRIQQRRKEKLKIEKVW